MATRDAQTEYGNLIKQIKSGNAQPVYFLHGEEPHYIDGIVDEVQNGILTEGERSFNLAVLYGKEVDFKRVVDECRQFPMMAEKRVVVLREAQQMKDIDALSNYIEHPNPSTVLAIAYKHKKLDGRTAFAKKVKKNAVVFESTRIYDNQVPAWIRSTMTAQGLQIEDGATHLMAEHLGNDLSKIGKEIEKLQLNIPAGSRITEAMIKEHVGISNEYNVFELQKAMGAGNLKKTMMIVDHFSRNTKTNHPIMIIGILFNYFTKLMITGVNKNTNDQTLQRKLGLSSSYFLRDYKQAIRFFNGRKVINAFSLLAEYDLKFKGVNNRSQSNGELLKEMIFKMMVA